MRVKKYQDRALERVTEWSRELKARREQGEQAVAALANTEVDESAIQSLRDYPLQAWRALEKRGELPQFKGKRGNRFVAPYVARADSLGNPIPHACLRIPTGGGKTFLGVSALARLGVRSGLVLWIVPSRAIYEQTRAAFQNRDHPYRATLDVAAGGRFKLLKKGDLFSRADVDGNLCVMPLMLQAAARRKERDFLRMFRDTGGYSSFFPEVDDRAANLAALKEHPDLESYGLTDGGEPGMVKQSLLNVFKLVRPVIVLDEAQNASTEVRSTQLREFNPELVLELSATPDFSISNILVDISGEELQREQMIKLPLHVSSPPKTDWKKTMARAKKRRDELEEAAQKFREQSGRYIRPIMLVRAERTGKDQRGGGHIHTEDAREFLMTQLNVPAAQIRMKTAENDEIAGEDLLSEYSEARYILTKDALREGWDCAFAYVLALLDSTTSINALTQMTGRILRQPEAEWTRVDALDRAYVFCCNRNVGAAAKKVKDGLEAEGLGDLAQFVHLEGESGVARAEELILSRRQSQFAQLRVVLPRVLHRRKRKFVPLDYEEDILSAVPWADISRRPLALSLGEVDKTPDSIFVVDLPKHDFLEMPEEESDEEKPLLLGFFVRYLTDVIPNPFAAARIVRNALDSLRKAGSGNNDLYDRRYRIAEAMKRRLARTVEAEARAVFCRKLESGEIRFQLEAGEGYELPVEEAKSERDDAAEFRVLGRHPEKSLLEPMLRREFNTLERDFVIHLEGVQAVEWWHRFAAHRGYALQGWRRHQVYPDFVACLREGRGRERQVAILETKGMHLSGNLDTEYKRELLGKLSAANPRALECGSFTLKTGGKERKMVLRLLLEDDWREKFDELAAGTEKNGRAG